MLKVAVIGIGEQSWDNILPSLAQIPSITTVAVCDIDKSRADLAAKKYGARAFDDYHTMIETEELDAIVVASYPDVHYEVAKLALKKQIAVFIEKPPTFTSEELHELISLNKNNVITGVGLNFNYAEAVNIVDKLSEKKDFGKIKFVSISHYGNKPREPIWGLKSTVKSFLLAQAIHPIGFLTKYGENLVSHDVKTINTDGNLFISGSFILENNHHEQLIANFTTGNMSPYFMWRIEIITDKSIVIRINSLWELEIFDSNKSTNMIDDTKRWRDVWNPSPLSNGYARTGYYHQFDRFFYCVKNKIPFSSSLEHLIPVYRILNLLENKLEAKQQNSYEFSQELKYESLLCGT